MCEYGSTESTSRPALDPFETALQRDLRVERRGCRARASRLSGARSSPTCRSGPRDRRGAAPLRRLRAARDAPRESRRRALRKPASPSSPLESKTTTRGSGAPDSRSRASVCGRVDEDQARAGMLEDVGGVIERLRRIDRHDDAAGKEASRSRTTIQSTQLCEIRATRSPAARPASRIAHATFSTRSSSRVARSRRPVLRATRSTQHFVARLRERSRIRCGSVSFGGSS